VSEQGRPTFDELLVSAGQGSPWALGRLYRRFQPGLLRLLSVIAPQRADEVAADVWLDIAADLARFAGDERAFRATLAATARSRVIGLRCRSAPLESRTVDDLGAFAARLVSGLPPEQADVVRLRVVGGFDVDDVARLLGRPPATVRSLQHRALLRLARRSDCEAVRA
jgi:RNA polymerase sigma-70 factor (ECF subfamily)